MAASRKALIERDHLVHQIQRQLAEPDRHVRLMRALWLSGLPLRELRRLHAAIDPGGGRRLRSRP